MKEILLTQGKVTLVDDGDYEHLNQWKWFAQRNYRTFYAARRPKIREPLLFMHQIIMGIEHKGRIDHKNGDGLDNRKENLRICLPEQNNQNIRHKWGNKSKYKGVSPSRSRWYAYIDVNKRRIHLGTYETEEIAARIYDAASRKYFGEFSAPNLNFENDILENLQEKFRVKPSKSSQYKGVFWNSLNNKWQAGIIISSKFTFLGYYEKEKDAARAYNAVAIKHLGISARINIIPDLSMEEQITAPKKKIAFGMSGYRGVYWRKDMQKWWSIFTYKKQRIFLGYFQEKVDAAIAYDNKARSILGEKAILNFS